ncbi:MAG: hypothetical protein V1828_00815 [Candidatus Omnitrophota bacterium]
MRMTIAQKVNVIGVLAIVAGILTGLWFLTVGVYITLWAYDTNKEGSVFLFLILGIAFALMFLLGGVGALRRRPRARKILIVTSYLLCAVVIWFVVGNIIAGLQEIEYGSFGFFSWIGGTVFCIILGAVFFRQALFLKKPEVKELFEA